MINDLYTLSTQLCIYDQISERFKYYPTNKLRRGDIFKMPNCEGFEKDIHGDEIVLRALSNPDYNKLGYFEIKVEEFLSWGK